jgi:hypothetical protein
MPETESLVWPPLPKRKSEAVTLQEVLETAIERYTALLIRLGHKQAADHAIASILNDVTRPGVKLGGMLAMEEGPLAAKKTARVSEGTTHVADRPLP